MGKTELRRGDVVVVTGASAGIGRASALAFAGRGAKVALLARGEAGFGSGRGRGRAGWRHGAGGTGGRRRCRRRRCRGPARRGGTRPDRRVGERRVLLRLRPLRRHHPAEYRRATEVSYLGFVYATMAALRHMRPRDRGTIVQVGSALAYRGIPLQTAYCGAKHAVQGFHESLRCELLHEHSGVKVTMVQTARGQHPAVLLGAVQVAAGRPSRSRRSTSPKSPPPRCCTPGAPQPAGVLGRFVHRRAPWRQRDRARDCSTATSPGPDSIPNRPPPGAIRTNP